MKEAIFALMTLWLLAGCAEIGEQQNLEHGREQVRNMLKDRHLMRKYLSEDNTTKYVREKDIIWQWVANRFAGQGIGKIIYWSPEKPNKANHCIADNAYPIKSRKGKIRIREKYLEGRNKGQNIPFEVLWNSAVFELHNVANGDKFYKIYKEACAGKLNKKSWITKNTKLEYYALKQTVEFYERVWEPWARKNGFETNPLIWQTNSPKTYLEWIKKYKDKSRYPWSYWGTYYNDEIVPYLKRKPKDKPKPKEKEGTEG